MKTIIGVMGGGDADAATIELAHELGAAIAHAGWVLLTGGRNVGVMDAASQGAHSAGGLVIGVLPDTHTERMSAAVDLPILTGMGDGRNIINVLSSRVVVALRGGAGTLSEIALALKAGRPVILLNFDVRDLFGTEKQSLHYAESVDAVISLIQHLLTTTATMFDPST